MTRAVPVVALIAVIVWAAVPLAAQTAASSAPSDPDAFAGTWVAEEVGIRSTNCSARLTDGVRDRIADGAWACTFTIEPELTSAWVVQECPDGAFTYRAEYESGRLFRAGRTRLIGDRCQGVFTNTVAVDLTTSPAAITVTYAFAFDPDCGVADCHIVIAGRLHRIQVAAGANGPTAAKSRTVRPQRDRLPVPCRLAQSALRP